MPQQAPPQQPAATAPPAEAAQPETVPADGADQADEGPGIVNEYLDALVERWFPYLSDRPVLEGLATLLALLILASLTSWFLKRVVARFLAKTETTLDDTVLSALTGPIYVSMLAAGMQLALVRIGISDKASNVIGSLLGTIVILAWAIAALRISKALLGSLGRTGRVKVLRPDTLPLFSNLATIAVAMVAIYLLVVAWGGNLSGLLALGGVSGLIIGLAAQDTIGNVFAGLFIFADSPYKVGDYINLDSGERGKVTSIGLRSTRVLTRDDVEVTIPNSVIGGAKVVNETGGPHTRYRIRVPVGVAYGTDLRVTREALLEVAAKEELVEPDPEPRVRMRGFGASSLDLELLCWIQDPELRGRALDALFMSVYDKLNELDIEIPYAKRDLYIKELPGQSQATDSEEFIA